MFYYFGVISTSKEKLMEFLKIPKQILLKKTISLSLSFFLHAMKFSSSHLGEKSHHNRLSQREKWGWFTPLLWSFLGMTAIVSFFFFSFSSLSPPNPFLVLRPKLLGLQSVVHDPIASPPKGNNQTPIPITHFSIFVDSHVTFLNWEIALFFLQKNRGAICSKGIGWRM